MPFSADPTDVLLTLAEVSVTFAGFASVVAIFQVRFTAERHAVRSVSILFDADVQPRDPKDRPGHRRCSPVCRRGAV